MSDETIDVVPQESVVDSPDTYQNEEADTKADADPVDDTGEQTDNLDDDEIISLDGEADETETDAAESEGDEEGEDDETEPETIEFDFGGNKLEIPKDQVPKELVGKIDEFSKNLWSDYTKKSQANAETAKQLEARQQSLAKIESLGGEALEAFTQGKSIKAELEQLNAVNVQALWQSDPDRARQLTDLKAQKSAQLQEIIATVDQYESQLDATRQQEAARLSQEGESVLNRKYKNFSSEIAPKLIDYVVQNHGMNKDEAEQWRVNPRMTEMAYKAMLYDQMRQANTPKSKPKQAKPVKAVKNAGKGRSVSSDPNKWSDAEWNKALGIK